MTRPTPRQGDQPAGFSHHGPGGDDALARKLPGLVTTLHALTVDGHGVVIGGGGSLSLANKTGDGESATT